MICLRCGYCCIRTDVMIVVDPELGPVQGNVEHKKFNEVCRHLRGNKPGEYSCAIHHYSWYKDTPCFSHTQIEPSPDTLCRMGEYLLKKREITKTEVYEAWKHKIRGFL